MSVQGLGKSVSRPFISHMLILAGKETVVAVFAFFNVYYKAPPFH
jgi:hypothetical protein